MFSNTLALLRLPAFMAAAASILLATLAQAIGGTYMTLLAVDRAHMTPLQLTMFLTASAASGIGFTTLFGRWLDRDGKRWPLLLSLVAAITGYALIGVVVDPWVLTLIALTLLGLGAPAFALLFGIAKSHLDSAPPEVASAGMASLRMLSSVAWTAGPAIGALAIWLWSYPGVYFGAAGCGLVTLIIVMVAGLKPARREVSPEEQSGGRAVWRLAWPMAVALVCFHVGMFMGSNALIVVSSRDLQASEADIGLIFSVCAAVEVVVLLAFVLRPAKRASRAMLAVGFVIYVAYFMLPLMFPSLMTIYWTQILRGTAIAIVAVLGMMYLQELMPTRPGAASALFANTAGASLLISGLGTGSLASAFGFWSIFGVCAVLSVIGLACVAISPSQKVRA